MQPSSTLFNYPRRFRDLTSLLLCRANCAPAHALLDQNDGIFFNSLRSTDVDSTITGGLCKLRDGAEFHEVAHIIFKNNPNQRNAKFSIEGDEAERIFQRFQAFGIRQIGTEFWVKTVDDNKDDLFGPFTIANVDTRTPIVFDFKPPAPNKFTDKVSFSLFLKDFVVVHDHNIVIRVTAGNGNGVFVWFQLIPAHCSCLANDHSFISGRDGDVHC